MFRVKFNDNTEVNVDKHQIIQLVENTLSNIIDFHKLNEDEEIEFNRKKEIFASVGVSLEKVESQGWKISQIDGGTFVIDCPYAPIEIKETRFGTLISLVDGFFRGNKNLPISGGEHIDELINDAESQLEFAKDDLVDDNIIDMLEMTIENFKSITTSMTECTTSSAIATVAQPLTKKDEE